MKKSGIKATHARLIGAIINLRSMMVVVLLISVLMAKRTGDPMNIIKNANIDQFKKAFIY